MENDFVTIKKYFYRFLKENGCFKKYFICKKSIHSIEICTPWLWLQDSYFFCSWCTTSEKDVFWWAISILWQYECVVNGLDKNIDISKLMSLITAYKKYYDNYKEYFNHNRQINTYTCVDINIILSLQEKVDNVNNNLIKMLCQKQTKF